MENFRRVKLIPVSSCEWDLVSKLWVSEEMWSRLRLFDLKIKEKSYWASSICNYICMFSYLTLRAIHIQVRKLSPDLTWLQSHCEDCPRMHVAPWREGWPYSQGLPLSQAAMWPRASHPSIQISFLIYDMEIIITAPPASRAHKKQMR